MANILLLSLVFPPDSVSTAQIMGGLVTELKARGHKISILTTAPHYNRDPEAESQQPLRYLWGTVLRKSNFHGIPVFHAFMPPKGNNLFLRILAWCGFHLISLAACASVVSKPDIIIAPSPPLTIGVIAWLIGIFFRVPFIYNVQEIYPDIAISLGAIRDKRIIKILFKLERFVYQKATCITVIAPRMRQRLLEKRVTTDKVKVVPNFVDIEELTPVTKDNAFSRQYKVDGKFLVSYAGNMGPAQGLETFVEAAQILQSETEIHFMMMGGGISRGNLIQLITSLGLANFDVLPYQPYSLMPSIYSASSICLVPQASMTGCDAVPSKVYRIMACARPVLATTDLDSDLSHLVSSVGCGVAIQAGSFQKLADIIYSAYQHQDLWDQMGKKGREHVIQNYTRSTIADGYHNIIQNILN